VTNHEANNEWLSFCIAISSADDSAHRLTALDNALNAKLANLDMTMNMLSLQQVAPAQQATVAGATALGSIAGIVVGATGMIIMKNKFSQSQTGKDFM
jgi:hypothetical protein